jgi:hypothetical protein
MPTAQMMAHVLFVGRQIAGIAACDDRVGELLGAVEGRQQAAGKDRINEAKAISA